MNPTAGNGDMTAESSQDTTGELPALSEISTVTTPLTTVTQAEETVPALANTSAGMAAGSCVAGSLLMVLREDDEHSHDHAHNANTHHHHHADGSYSWFTKQLMQRCEPGSLVYGILSEKDSRRIAYFTW